MAETFEVGTEGLRTRSGFDVDVVQMRSWELVESNPTHLLHVWEPYRTMALIAGCLGLRAIFVGRERRQRSSPKSEGGRSAIALGHGAIKPREHSDNNECLRQGDDGQQEAGTPQCGRNGPASRNSGSESLVNVV